MSRTKAFLVSAAALMALALVASPSFATHTSLTVAFDDNCVVVGQYAAFGVTIPGTSAGESVEVRLTTTDPNGIGHYEINHGTNLFSQGGFHDYNPGYRFNTVGTQTITVVDTGNASISDTDTIQVAQTCGGPTTTVPPTTTSTTVPPTTTSTTVPPTTTSTTVPPTTTSTTVPPTTSTTVPPTTSTTVPPTTSTTVPPTTSTTMPPSTSTTMPPSTTSTVPPTGTKTVLTADLSGAEEVPGPGDPDASGQSVVRVGAGGSLCYRVRVQDVAPITGAHIHEAPAGSAGPIVVPLASAPETQANGTQVIRGCVDVGRELAQDILADPSDYYVNVHNAEYPNGAARGQLAPREAVDALDLVGQQSSTSPSTASTALLWAVGLIVIGGLALPLPGLARRRRQTDS